MKTNWRNLTRGIIRENPLFMVGMGLCPALAVTSRLIDGLGMGVAVLFVMVFSNLTVSLLRNFIPGEARVPCHVLIVAAFVTVAQLLLKAFFPELDRSLGIFVPLIAVNCIVLGRAESFASKHPPLDAVLEALGTGFGFMLSLALIGAVRETLGSGVLTLRLAGTGSVLDLRAFISDPAAVMTLPAGGFFIAGLLFAFFNFIRIKTRKTADAPQETNHGNK